MAQAVTAGCRVTGFVTPTPSFKTSVTWAAAVSPTKGVRHQALGVTEAQPVKTFSLCLAGHARDFAGNVAPGDPDLQSRAVRHVSPRESRPARQ